jgi:hypothetical protein
MARRSALRPGNKEIILEASGFVFVQFEVELNCILVVEFVRRLVFIQEQKFMETGFEGRSVQF